MLTEIFNTEHLCIFHKVLFETQQRIHLLHMYVTQHVLRASVSLNSRQQYLSIRFPVNHTMYRCKCSPHCVGEVPAKSTAPKPYQNCSS